MPPDDRGSPASDGSRRLVSRAMNPKEPRDKVTGRGGSTLPEGMTQEEADRLVREADLREKENA